jgi:glyoxylate reductase
MTAAGRPLVVSTSPLPGPWLEGLAEDFELRVLEGDTPPEHLREELREAEALISLLSDSVDAQLLAAAPKLKIVANYAVGIDNVDRAAAAARGIVVTNTPGVLTDATADLAIAMLLALARRLREGDRLVRAGGFAGWRPDLLLGMELKGKTLGIVGPGRIGKATARRAKAFGMNVVAWGRSNRDESDPNDPVRVSFDELLRRSDVVSIHLPLTRETRHIISTEVFTKMKPGSFLLNTARGPLVDEMALCRALDEERIAGAGLDVFENEPIVSPALLDDERVLLMPHAGSATVEARREMARMVCEDVRRVLGGERPLRAAPPERA